LAKLSKKWGAFAWSVYQACNLENGALTAACNLVPENGFVENTLLTATSKSKLGRSRTETLAGQCAAGGGFLLANLKQTFLILMAFCSLPGNTGPSTEIIKAKNSIL